MADTGSNPGKAKGSKQKQIKAELHMYYIFLHSL
jgi:hypothetical protein